MVHINGDVQGCARINVHVRVPSRRYSRGRVGQQPLYDRLLDLYGGDKRTLTADRTEFIGRNGTLSDPAALGRIDTSRRTGRFW